MKVNPNRIDHSLTSGLGKQDRLSKTESSEGGLDSKKISQGMIDSSARINISDKAKEMARVKELAKQAPDVDAEKVAKFRAMIERGDYKVNAEALADRMLEDELSLAGTQES